MIKSIVHKTVSSALETMGCSGEKLELSIPSDPTHGDYTTNIAFQLTKKLHKAPFAIATQLAQAIQKDDCVAQATAVAPGFVNIHLHPSYIESRLSNLTKLQQNHTNQKILCEFTDPNPFKEFHIGHLYSNTVGESISRLLESSGAHVSRVNYQGDVGVHVACSVWGMLEKLEIRNSKFEIKGAQTALEEIGKLPLNERVKWLGTCYAYGATKRKEDSIVDAAIKALNAQLFLAGQNMWKKNPDFAPIVDYAKFVTTETCDPAIVQYYYETGRKWTLEYFDEIYARLGTKFDHYFFESYVGELGWKIAHEYLEKKVFLRSEGAIVFKGEDYGLHTRVIVNSLGLPTYEAKELGLAQAKQDYVSKKLGGSLTQSISVTGNEIAEYFKVMIKAMSLMYPDYISKFTHIAHGMVRLPEGKMSSRTGKVVSGETLLDEVAKRVRPIVEKSEKLTSGSESLGHDIKNSEKDSVTEKLTIAAVKYAFLKSSIGKDVIFDFDESLSLEGNTGPYLLYTIVRCNSIKGKAHSATGRAGNNRAISPASHASNPHTDITTAHDLTLMRKLLHFSDICEQATSSLSPHLICTYAHELAQEFNSYYAKVPILKSESDALALRIQLVTIVQNTLTQCCHLLGFETVERM